jgi:hypothetical protein
MIRLIRYWPAAILVAVFSLFAAQEKKEELKSSKVEQELIDLTNEMRKAARLTPAAPSPGPLAANPKLMTAARAHAANMAALEKLDHTLEDKTFADRAKDAGYQYRLIGENIAWSPETPKEVLDAPGEHSEGGVHRDRRRSGEEPEGRAVLGPGLWDAAEVGRFEKPAYTGHTEPA